MERFVYLLRAGEDHYKVGVAQDVLERIRGVQTGNPQTIEFIQAVYVENALKAEKQLHMWLANFKADGGREWFQLTPEKAIELVAKMTALTLSADMSRYLIVRNLIARQTQLEKKMEDFLLTAEVKKPEPIIIETEQPSNKHDPYFDRAEELVRQHGKASASMLQRRLIRLAMPEPRG